MGKSSSSEDYLKCILVLQKKNDSVRSIDIAEEMVGFATLWLGTTIIVVTAIIKGALEVPKICLLLNPVPSTVVLLILKKCNVRIIGALGVGFMMFSILLIIAGL